MENNSFKENVKNTFFTGFLTLLPIAVILIFFVWLFDLLVSIIRPLLIAGGLNYTSFLFFLALFVLLLLIYLTGLLIRTKGGRYAFKQLELLLKKLIPGYKQVKSMLDSFTGKDSSKHYSSVVLVDIFQNGTYMTGFVTDKPTKSISTVFIPTGPNPTNGMIYHVNNKFLINVKVSPKVAFESIIAVGKNSEAIFNGSKFAKVSKKSSKSKK